MSEAAPLRVFLLRTAEVTVEMPSEAEKMEAARDAAAVAEYPPRDPPPMDADGFVVSFPPPRVRTRPCDTRAS